MKISKTALLTLSSVFSIAGLGFMFVSARDLNLNINPDNAVQHIESVKFVSGSTDNTATMKHVDNQLVEIKTKGNFVLSNDNSNEVGDDSKGSSVLGGLSNKIGDTFQSNYSVILGGNGGIINNGYSTILGGEGNTIGGAYSTILGGKQNTVKGGSSVIVGGNGNNIDGSKSVVVGTNSSVTGSLSAALGKNSKIEANGSFLWTDGEQESETLQADNVFAVVGGSGMVIGTKKAHNFAQLTLNGGLIIRNGTAPTCDSSNGGTIKVVNVSADKICLCSCDGNGWSSMFGLGKCKGLCDSNYNNPQCGEVVTKVCSGDMNVYSGSCAEGGGKVLEGTGAYFVDKYNKVYWSCQTDDGQVASCSGFSVGEGCMTHGTPCDYTVTYDANGGSPTPAPSVMSCGDSIFLANSPTRDGYSFAGWKSSVDNQVYSAGVSYTPTDNTMMTAQWGETTATLHYDANGCGTAPSDVTMSYASETKAVSMGAFTPGKTFEKWCTTSNGVGGTCYDVGGVVKPENTNPSDLTLYAICTSPTATLTYDANSCGTAPANVEMTYAAETKAASMANITAGKTFQRWCTTNNGVGGTCYTTGQVVKPANTIPSAIVLYAICTSSTATLTYNSNACGTAPADVALTYATEVKAASMSTVSVGKTFQKWCTTNDGVGGTCYTTGQVVKPANTTPSNIVLYAQCTQNENTLTVDPNAGKVTFDGANRTEAHSVKRKSGETIEVPNATRTRDVSGDGSYSVKYDLDGGTSTLPIQDQTAQKTKKIEYKFNKWDDSGTKCGTMAGTTYTFPTTNGTTCTKKANWTETTTYSTASVTLPSAPERGGYTFAGWKSSTDGQVYSAGDNYTPTDNTMMTAQWTTCSYKLTYQTNGGKWSDGSTSDKSVDIACGSSATALAGPQMDGYTFKNWKTKSSNGINVWYDAGSSFKPAGNMTLVAERTQNENTLTVNPNAGRVIFDGANRTEAHSVKKKSGETIKVPDATRGNDVKGDGSYTVKYDVGECSDSTPSEISATIYKITSYTFGGWDNGTSCGNFNTSTHVYTFPNTNGTTCTKTAKWTSNTTSSTDSVTLASISPKSGCTFNKWISSVDGSEHDAGEVYTPESDVKMTASCNCQEPFKVTFKANCNEIYDAKNGQYTTNDVVIECPNPGTNCYITAPKIKGPSDGNPVGYTLSSTYSEGDTLAWYSSAAGLLSSANNGNVYYAHANHTKTYKMNLNKDDTSVSSIGANSVSCTVIRYDCSSWPTTCDMTFPSCTANACYQNCKFGTNYLPNTTYRVSLSNWSNGTNPTLTAKATIKKFTVTYNPAGGKWSDGTTTNKISSNVSCGKITLEGKPSKESCNFNGWRSSSDGGLYPEKADYPLIGDTTMTAEWSCTTTKTFKATFKANGNQIINPNNGQTTSNDVVVTCTTAGSSCSINSPSIVAPNATPSVIGWSTSSTNHTSQWDVGAGKNISSDVTYYAQTTKNAVSRHISFWVNGNTRFTYKGTSYNSHDTFDLCTINATYNGDTQGTRCSATITFPTITAHSNTPNVIGWSKSSTNHTAAYTAGQANVSLTADSDLTFYAQTKNGDKNMKVNLAVGVGVSSIGASSKSCTIYTTYNGVAQGTSCSVKLPTCTVKDCYENCKFGTYEPEANYTITNDNAELTATATIKKYGVTYKINGGKFVDGTTADKYYDVECGDSVTLRHAQWSQHTFVGWWTAQNGGDYVGTSSDIYRPTASVTLWAHWEESHAGCVNYSSSNQCTDGITGTPITSTDPTKEMWTCGGDTSVICEKCAAGLSYTDGVCKRYYPKLIIDSISACQMKYHFVPYTPFTNGTSCCNPVRFERSYDGNTWSYVTTNYDGDISITTHGAQGMIYIRYTVDNGVTYSDISSYNMSLQSCTAAGDYKVDWRGNPFDWQLGKAYYVGADGNIHDANIKKWSLYSDIYHGCQGTSSSRDGVNVVAVGDCFESGSPIAGVPLYLPCQVNSAKCWCTMELQQDGKVVSAQNCYSRLYYHDTL